MDSHQLDIARLAWARALGLVDDALTTSGVRLTPHSHTITFLRLGDVDTLAVPAPLVERAQERPLADFTDPSALLSLTDDRSARHTGPTTLHFASDYAASSPEPDANESPLVSDDPAHAHTLAAGCPPDDLTESALTQCDTTFTLLRDDETPVAAAGYTELEGLLADVAALTAPDCRRCGHASTIGRITTDEALDNGLIPQFRAHRDNYAAHALARTLGYTETGVHMSVNVQPPTG